MPDTNRFVEKRSAEEIADLANMVREALQLGQERVAMAPLLELALPEIIDDYELLILPDEQLGTAEGLTDLIKPIICLPERTYSALLAAEPRARFTAAHELGHLLMHTSSHVHYARAEHSDPNSNPEWQANVFASAFLMPETAFRQCRTAQEAMQRFGVSFSAVRRRAKRLKHRLRGLSQNVACAADLKRKGASQ